MKKNYSLSFLLLVLTTSFYSQLTVLQNDATVIHVENSGIFYVEGNIITENTGIWDNSGTIHMSGDWVNNSTTNGFLSTSTGLVRMFGGNQAISGTTPTHFYDLTLDGGSSTKDLLTDAEVWNQLDLIDAELQTNNVVMHVTNPNPSSILWNTGFVSANTLGGYLARSTNSSSNYIFPIGDWSLSSIYRAVEITPNTNDSNVFAARVAAIDPTFDFTGVSATGATGGFDVSVKNPLVGNINTNFYHNIAHTFGPSTANVGVNYFSSDGDYSSMAQWQDNTTQWENTLFMNSSIIGASNIGSPNMFSYIASYADFTHDLFALSNVNGVRIPQFISPNQDGQNDVLIIDNIEHYPDNKLQVFNRYGNIVFEKEGYNNDWDGTVSNNKNPIFNYSGSALPSGTYFYILDLGVEELEPYSGYVHIRK